MVGAFPKIPRLDTKFWEVVPPPFQHGEFSVRFRASCEALVGTCHATLLCGLRWLIIPHNSTGYILGYVDTRDAASALSCRQRTEITKASYYS